MDPNWYIRELLSSGNKSDVTKVTWLEVRYRDIVKVHGKNDYGIEFKGPSILFSVR